MSKFRQKIGAMENSQTGRGVVYRAGQCAPSGIFGTEGQTKDVRTSVQCPVYPTTVDLRNVVVHPGAVSLPALSLVYHVRATRESSASKSKSRKPKTAPPTS